jgi:hypothetical protein
MANNVTDSQEARFLLDEFFALSENARLLPMSSIENDQPSTSEQLVCPLSGLEDVEPDSPLPVDLPVVQFHGLCQSSSLFPELRRQKRIRDEAVLRGAVAKRPFELTLAEDDYVRDQGKRLKRLITKEEELFLRAMFSAGDPTTVDRNIGAANCYRFDFFSCKVIDEFGVFPGRNLMHLITVEGLLSNRFCQYSLLASMNTKWRRYENSVFALSPHETCYEGVVGDYVFPTSSKFLHDAWTFVPKGKRYVFDKIDPFIVGREVLIVFMNVKCPNLTFKFGVTGLQEKWVSMVSGDKMGMYIHLNDETCDPLAVGQSRYLECKDCDFQIKVFELCDIHTTDNVNEYDVRGIKKCAVDLFNSEFALLFRAVRDFLEGSALSLVDTEAERNNERDELWGPDVYRRCFRAQRLVRLACILFGIPTTDKTTYLARMRELNWIIASQDGRDKIDLAKLMFAEPSFANWDLQYVITRQPDVVGLAVSAKPFKIVYPLHINKTALFSGDISYLC